MTVGYFGKYFSFVYFLRSSSTGCTKFSNIIHAFFLAYRVLTNKLHLIAETIMFYRMLNTWSGEHLRDHIHATKCLRSKLRRQRLFWENQRFTITGCNIKYSEIKKILCNTSFVHSTTIAHTVKASAPGLWIHGCNTGGKSVCVCNSKTHMVLSLLHPAAKQHNITKGKWTGPKRVPRLIVPPVRYLC